MDEKDIRIAERFKSLITQRVKIDEIRAFGSRARNNAKETSDLDILVVVDSPSYSIEKYISDCAWEAGFPDDVVVVPIVIGTNTLKNSPIKESVFIKNVYKEGIAI